MGILNGHPKEEPMHYGEVFHVWAYLAGAKAFVAGYQTLINHSGDKDLRKFLEDKIVNVIKPEIEQIEELLKENQVALPAAPPDRAKADLESIPTGARFNDPEIAESVSLDIAAGLVACSTIMGISIREDIGAMFAKFHANKAMYGVRLLRIKKDKGWLMPPPLHLAKT